MMVRRRTDEKKRCSGWSAKHTDSQTEEGN